MADEDTVLEEAMDNLKEAGQRIRATQSLMRSEGMTDGENHRDLLPAVGGDDCPRGSPYPVSVLLKRVLVLARGSDSRGSGSAPAPRAGAYAKRQMLSTRRQPPAATLPALRRAQVWAR
jgi:hypothetical protein